MTTRRVQPTSLVYSTAIAVGAVLLTPVFATFLGRWWTLGALLPEEPEQKGYFILYFAFGYALHLLVVLALLLFVEAVKSHNLRRAVLTYAVVLVGIAFCAVFLSRLSYPLFRYVPACVYVFVVLPLISRALVMAYSETQA